MSSTDGPRDHGQPVDETGPYVGLAVDTARERAVARGWDPVRVIDREDAVITLELIPTRINFVVPEGRVTRCWFG